MRARLADLWELAWSGFWFLPGLMVLAATLLAGGAVELDRRLTTDGEHLLPFLFTGTADAVRTILSTIATALVTVAALTFSVMMVAISQVASRLTPRVLQAFMDDLGNRLVLGGFIGTFAYCLIVLRSVRSASERGPGFIAPVAVTLAVALTLACLLLLVYFFHHSALLLQASTIQRRIHREVLEQVDHLYPDRVGRAASEPEERPPPRPAGPALQVRAEQSGFLRRIDEAQLLSVVGADVRLVRVHARIGTYVGRRAVLAEVWADGEYPDDLEEAIRGAFVLGHERTLHQDLLFGVKQLVDIAVKALSPGVNDPTTAEYSLSHLRDIVVLLADRRFPPRLRRGEDAPTLFWLERPGFADVVAAAFAQIRRAAAEEAHVTGYLLDMLAAVRQHACSDARADAVCREVREVLAHLPAAPFTPADRDFLRAKAEAILAGAEPEEVQRPDDFENLPA